MKVIIDLIEDIREETGNQENFMLTAMLLREDPENTEKLIYAGESPIDRYHLDEEHKLLMFKIDGSGSVVTTGELLNTLLVLPIADMMYELKIDVNAKYCDIEVVGFGKSMDEKKYILFIKI